MIRLGLFLAVLAVFGLLLGCPIKRLTGLPCPGCGMTRGCLSLIKLDFSAAVHWHPLCFIVPLLGVMYALKDSRPGRLFWSCVPLLAAIIVLIMAVYIWRMVAMFPDVPPMDFYKNAVFVKFVHKILLH
ncbi:MAG: DUF2752 domain-containing protein [Oscillospiraceae bacterium]|nr:DUF2752 domain-containing protein [Oscillospiraceae bacterium]